MKGPKGVFRQRYDVRFAAEADIAPCDSTECYQPSRVIGGGQPPGELKNEAAILEWPVIERNLGDLAYVQS